MTGKTANFLGAFYYGVSLLGSMTGAFAFRVGDHAVGAMFVLFAVVYFAAGEYYFSRAAHLYHEEAKKK